MITDPAAFHGRQSEIRRVVDRIKKQESTSIVGPRRIGKSSVAFRVLGICSTDLQHFCKCAWLDGQSNHLSSVDRFCRVVAEATGIPYVPSDKTRDCLLAFEDAVKASSQHLVLVFNEFEVLTSPSHRNEFTQPFFNTLRLLAEQGRCSLITTSHLSLQQVCKDVLEVSSPFYNIFDELVLEHFTDEEADAFLAREHSSVSLTAAEISFIRSRVSSYQHPLVLQIAADSVVSARNGESPSGPLRRTIAKRVRHFLTHREVEESRRMSQRRATSESTLSKPVDLAISILFPLLGIGLFMLELTVLLTYLNPFQSILLVVASAITGIAVMVFAGRSIAIIGETTFFKLFSALISHIPLLSSLSSAIGKAVTPSSGTDSVSAQAASDESKSNHG